MELKRLTTNRPFYPTLTDDNEYFVLRGTPKAFGRDMLVRVIARRGDRSLVVTDTPIFDCSYTGPSRGYCWVDSDELAD